MEYEIMSSSITGNVTNTGNKLIFNYPCKSSTECAPYKISFRPGLYQITLFGAQGGDARYVNTPRVIVGSGGKGAFVQGRIVIKKRRTLYLYIGGAGEVQSSTAAGSFGHGGYNGGGDGGNDYMTEVDPESGAGGGGATDIRLVYGNDFASHKSRIIVAAGGGGASSGLDNGGIVEYGGFGGSLEGISTNICSKPGTQTSGSFGYGENGSSSANKYNGGAGGNGGGYYGGKTCDFSLLPKRDIYEFGGAGGSSFISGYLGCNAISATSSKSKILHLNHSIFDNEFDFFETQMKSGKDTFVNAYGVEEIGHSGNGAAIIEFINGYKVQNTCRLRFLHSMSQQVVLLYMALMTS